MMITRRDFQKIIAGTAASSLLMAKINSVVDGVQLGCQSYSFRDRSLDDALKAMTEIGLGECELWQGHVEPKDKRGKELSNWRETVPLDEFAKIRKKFDDAGIQLYAYNYSFRDNFSDKEIERGFEMTKALGVNVITASATVSVVPRIDPFAQKYKIRVGFHGHDHTENPNEFSTPETFAKAMDGHSKYMCVNLDIGHFTAAGFDAVDYLEKHHDRIVTLHFKDRKKNHGANLPFGQGETPIKEVLQVLKTKHYKIPANIEYEYKGADSQAEVAKCYQYMKQALA
ncbi:MAG TPA: sugar phosphate isomerase/epimerase [Bryobacteraceae bacterium]|jgi:sugar phosphate isomerase/epimerase